MIANASHLADQVVSACEPLGVEVSVEPGRPLGTVGGLARARSMLKAEVVVTWNGDIVADADPRVLVDRLCARDESATLLVRRLGAPGTGPIGLDELGRVVRLRKTTIGVLGRERHGAEFAAIYAQSWQTVQAAPAEGDIVSELWIPLLSAGATMGSVVYEGRFHDVGDLGSYLACNLDMLDGAHASVHPTARVGDSVELDRVCVGAGADVAGNGRLCRVVVWPSASARAPLANSIVMDDGSVVPVPA